MAADKAKDVAAVAADKTKDAAELTRISMAIAGEQKEIDKNYRTIGEWFVNEYEGRSPTRCGNWWTRSPPPRPRLPSWSPANPVRMAPRLRQQLPRPEDLPHLRRGL